METGFFINRGGHYNRLESKVTVTDDSTEAVALPATINILTEADVLQMSTSVNELNKQKKTQSPLASPFFSPPASPILAPELDPRSRRPTSMLPS